MVMIDEHMPTGFMATGKGTLEAKGVMGESRYWNQALSRYTS
jgi:hypothetical protein